MATPPEKLCHIYSFTTGAALQIHLGMAKKRKSILFHLLYVHDAPM